LIPSGNNILQFPDNTKVTKSQWTKDALRITLSDNKEITISGASTFTFNAGGNIFSNDKGQNLSFNDFAELFGMKNIANLAGSDSSSENNKFILAGDSIIYKSDSYSLGNDYDSSKPRLESYSDMGGDLGVLNFDYLDNIIVPVNSGTYRGLDGDDTYLLSELTNQNSEIAIIDTKGKNTIQIPDNTKIIESKWAKDSMQIKFSNGAIITINGADKFDYDLGANFGTGDEGDTLTYDNLAAIFDILLPTSGIEESSSEYYII
jgi:hypothetical protein